MKRSIQPTFSSGSGFHWFHRAPLAMSMKSKRILPPESWFLPAEDRNSRRRAQRRIEQKRFAEARGASRLEVASAADD
jgi:hypothetical protein